VAVDADPINIYSTNAQQRALCGHGKD
jgi:hypothetical protein